MKKTGSHVGFVLSFVVFVTFLIFIYSVLVPTTKIQDKPLILEKVGSEEIRPMFGPSGVSMGHILP